MSNRDEPYYCPDVFVTCDLRDRHDLYIKRYPKLIVEVLSSSTEAFDRGDKFDDYQKIESLEEYVLIPQQRQQVKCRRRTAENTWKIAVYEAGDIVMLKSIELSLPIAELYRGLDG